MKLKLVIAAMFLLLVDSIIYIPQNHMAITVRFGQNVEMQSDFIGFKIPIIESYELYEIKDAVSTQS